MNECNCGTKFSTKLAPCPDGREGCLVAHYAKDAYVCPNCGHDYGPEVCRAIVSGRIKTEVGAAIVNVRAVAKLEFYSEK